MRYKTLKENLEGYLFLSPWLFGFLVFMLVPSLWSIYLAFTDYNFMNKPHFTGWDNIDKMIHSDVFWNSLKVSSIYAAVSVPLHLITALSAALLLNVKLKGIGFYRAAYYMPSIVGGSIGVALMWRMLFSDSGFANSLLHSLGFGSIKFFSIDHALYTLIGISLWTLGSAMLIFLAGLQQIPHELYESAKVDGAAPFRRFRSITFPLLTPVIFFNLILGLIGGLQVFNAGFVITHGGPAKATYFYVLYLYEEAFRYHRMGYATMLAWVLVLLCLTITLLTFKSSSTWVYYETEVKGKGGNE